MRKKAALESNGNGQVLSGTRSNTQVMRRILKCLTAVEKGVFSVRLPSDWTDLEGKVADSFNEIIAANERMAKELRRVSHMVGKQGKIAQRAAFSIEGGAWQGMEESLNSLISDLASPTLEVTRTI